MEDRKAGAIENASVAVSRREDVLELAERKSL
jgi:hypothetical protein